MSRKVTDYDHLSDISHVYKRPDAYVGSCKSQKFITYTMDLESKKLVKKEVNTAQAIQRLFLEVASNSADNIESSRRAKIDPGTINIDVTDTTVTIKNGGLHIPVEKISTVTKNGNTAVLEYKEGDENWMWLPVFIFGKLRTSNNYDETIKRMGCGRNGFGAKLTNIFSKKFVLEIKDPSKKLHFKAVWKDNMFKDSPETKPEIEVISDKEIKEGSVTISWDLDFERFGITKYSKEDLDLFARFTVDFSFTCKIRTYFNGLELDYRDIKDYAKLIWTEEEMKNNIVNYMWEEGTPDKIKKSKLETQRSIIKEGKKSEHIPALEILIIDTTDNSDNITYVNGLVTSEGGVHLDAAQEQVFKFISNIVNDSKTKGKKNIITAKNIKNHLSFIVNARVINPEYTSQTKTKLSSPSVSVSYQDKTLKNIESWDVIQRMYSEIDAISFNKAVKNDGSKRKHIPMNNGEDANFAGTNQSLKCKLFLVEGISAASYPQKRICMLEGGKDYHGYMPLKGVFMNTSKANKENYGNNAVIASVKQVLGLKEDLDYDNPENIKTLRYGFIILTVDADDDGMHILCLVLNFFREKFPGIIRKNMIGYLRTPVIKVMKGNKIVKRFFTVDSFEKYKSSNSLKGNVVRYFKGLGTSNDDDIKDDLKTAPTIICFHDSKCIENFDLAFHEDNADQRKDWIEKWRDVSQCDDVISIDINTIKKDKNDLIQAQDISQLINRELIGFSVSSLIRALPSKYDFLKDSQRKALYSALSYFNWEPKKGKSMKVGRAANKAADMTQYHHGEKSLIDTWIKMAQDFTGSNNIGFFKKDGQFGTRACGGENAADGRYVETHITEFLVKNYYKDSVELIEKRITDDEECEPLWIPGVIPMGVVNGTNGIATAFSTSTPSHNPLDVVKWYINKCEGKTPKPIIPWYNGFTGKFTVTNRDKGNGSPTCETVDKEKEKYLTSPVKYDDFTSMDEESRDLIENSNHARLTLKSYGKYEIIGIHKNNGPIIKVTELPVKTWIGKYRKWLEELIHSKNKTKPIFDFVDHSTTEKPEFIIHWNNNYKQPNHITLKLVRSFGISNITLIDHKGFPKRFNNVQETMELYYDIMIKHYNDMKENRIKIEENKVIDITYRMKFVINVLKDEIKIIKVKEETIKEKMEELKIPFEYYEKSRGKDFSVESVYKYRDQVKESKARLEIAKNTSAESIWLERLNILNVYLKKRFINGVLDIKN